MFVLAKEEIITTYFKSIEKFGHVATDNIHDTYMFKTKEYVFEFNCKFLWWGL